MSRICFTCQEELKPENQERYCEYCLLYTNKCGGCGRLSDFPDNWCPICNSCGECCISKEGESCDSCKQFSHGICSCDSCRDCCDCWSPEILEGCDPIELNQKLLKLIFLKENDYYVMSGKIRKRKRKKEMKAKEEKKFYKTDFACPKLRISLKIYVDNWIQTDKSLKIPSCIIEIITSYFLPFSRYEIVKTQKGWAILWGFKGVDSQKKLIIRCFASLIKTREDPPIPSFTPRGRSQIPIKLEDVDGDTNCLSWFGLEEMEISPSGRTFSLFSRDKNS